MEKNQYVERNQYLENSKYVDKNQYSEDQDPPAHEREHEPFISL